MTIQNNNAVQQTSTGIGFFGLLTLLFIGLKLTGYIDWNWFWVLSPFIFSVGFILLLLVVILIVFTYLEVKGK